MRTLLFTLSTVFVGLCRWATIKVDIITLVLVDIVKGMKLGAMIPETAKGLSAGSSIRLFFNPDIISISGRSASGPLIRPVDHVKRLGIVAAERGRDAR